MRHVLYLAWQYLRFNRGKSATLIVCLTLALALPSTVHWLVQLLQREMVQRASTTPVLVGAAGSRFDLTLHALYFEAEPPGTLPQAQRFAIDDSATFDAAAIPLFIRYEARGFPIVGTTLDYFSFRELNIAQGTNLSMLGDAVLGSAVARELELEPGDRLLSDPQNIFDLGGEYPLNMRVAGVLEPTHTPDDRAVFVDVRTAWIIDGIGHGHDESDDADGLAGQEIVRESPDAAMYNKITPENVGSFHFHLEPDERPLTAIIAVPGGQTSEARQRARTLLLGEYLDDAQPHQAVVPLAVIEQVMGMVVQIRRFFDVQYGLMLVVTVLFVALVMMLSLRLRRQEVRTMVHLGCSRGMIFGLQAAELVILLAISAALAAGLSWAAVQLARQWIATLTG